MRTLIRFSASVMVLLLSSTVSLVAVDFYLDCDAGNDGNPGTSPLEAWGTISKINSVLFTPGDRIFLKRGSHCQGPLVPHGSGSPEQPLLLAAYGLGPLPVIEGPQEGPVLQLFNQQFWHIRNLELVGGRPYGILISGDQGVLRHFRLYDLVIRGATGDPTDKRSGLLSIIAGSQKQTFEDVLVEGVYAHNTSQWAGIVVDGGGPPLPRGAEGKNPETLRARKVTVRNCVVHDVGGDGIILFRVEQGTIERCLSWNTGMLNTQRDNGPQNPNAIWTWNCHGCMVQFNEGFLADTPGVDGGIYDIDWGSRDSVIQYNYGHDAQGYCLSVFGAGGTTTTGSVVRYNVCVNNGRSPRLAERQGDVYLETWGGGALDGVAIYGNTFYWNPPTEAPALRNTAVFVGESPDYFKNNVIYSTSQALVMSKGVLDLEGNAYWYTGIGEPIWEVDGIAYQGATDYVAGRPDSGEKYSHAFSRVDGTEGPDWFPLVPPTAPDSQRRGDLEEIRRDFFGTPLKNGETPAAGAIQVPATAAERELLDYSVLSNRTLHSPGGGVSLELASLRGRWWLCSLLISPWGNLEGRNEEKDSWTRTQLMALKSAHRQFREKGLEVFAVVSQPATPDREEILNLAFDWSFGDIPLFVDPGSQLTGILAKEVGSVTILVSPEGELLRLERDRVFPQISLILRGLLGSPSGTAEMVVR